MEPIETLRIAAGAWQKINTTWEHILQCSDLEAQVIFASAGAIKKASGQLQDRVCEKFGISSFLFSDVYLESNGSSGCQTLLDEDQKLRGYNHWSRFVVKQLHKELRPKISFTRHRSATEKETLTAPSAPIHSKSTIKHGWEWYEMGFFVHWQPPQSTTMLCFDVPVQMRESLLPVLSSNVTNANLSDPYALFSTVVYELISLYNDSVWSLRNHVSAIEAGRSEQGDFPLLHEVARHAIHVSETLSVASESIKALQSHHLDFSTQTSQRKGTHSQTESHFEFQLQFLNGLFMRSESNKARIQNEITLAFNTAAQRDSATQTRIGQEAMKETIAMKAIAVVTMTFLPATFVASIFSMSFFHFEPAQGDIKESYVLSDKFWMYWALAAPLSIATLSIWAFWDISLGKRWKTSINP